MPIIFNPCHVSPLSPFPPRYFCGGVTFLVLLLFSCSPAYKLAHNPSPPEFVAGLETLDTALQEAATGSPRKIWRLASKGGAGAWFALAAAAEEKGYQKLSQNLRRRSVKEDKSPFDLQSLVNLLKENPRAIHRPLRALKRVESEGKGNPLWHAAKIKVLVDKGFNRELSREFSHFSAQAYEAPVLAAALQYGSKKNRRKAAEALPSFLISTADPAALLTFSKEAEDILGSAALLLQARKAYSLGQYKQALRDYHRWITAPSSPDFLSSLSLEKNIFPLFFREIKEMAQRSKKEEIWAPLLVDFARNVEGLMAYEAHYQAGELYRKTKQQNAASEAFIDATRSVSPGFWQDRALRRQLQVLLALPGFSTEKEWEALSLSIPSWSNPDYFESWLNAFLYRRVRRREWNLLAQAHRDWGMDWPASIRSRSAWILSAAISENRLLESRSAKSYLEEALAQAPLSWPGLRAAGILKKNPLDFIAENPEEEQESVNDLRNQNSIVRLYLRWNLQKLAATTVLADPSAYTEENIRLVAQLLRTSSPRLSIRVINILKRREGYQPTVQDLRISYPLPLPYHALARTKAAMRELPVELFYGLIRTESAWDSAAISRSGAQGLAQFMPSTWQEWAERLDYPENADPMDPQTNLTFSAAYLQWLEGREWTSGWVDVLVSYNAGGGRLRSWRQGRPGLLDDLFGESIPLHEPREYIHRVFSSASLYGVLYTGNPPHILHKQWGLASLFYPNKS